MTDNALEIRDLSLQLGKLTLTTGTFRLKDVGFSVKKGTIMGLVGKNGAGKTTLIKAIVDEIHPASGQVLFNGIPLAGNEETVKARIGVVYDSLIYPQSFRPYQIVKMIAPFYETFDRPYWEQLMNRFELSRWNKLSEYSKGMQMRFSLALALAYHPELLILDEPTAGIDPAARADILDVLLDFIQDENNAVLFSTHITSDLDKIADYITLIDHGTIRFSKEKDALLNEYALVHLDEPAYAQIDHACLLGARRTAFGYEALCADHEKLMDVPGIKWARPSVEDILIYGDGWHGHGEAAHRGA